MKSTFTWLILAGCGLLAGTARAQYTFTDANLNPYQQNFDGLAGTVGLTTGLLTGTPGVYAQAEFGPISYSPLAIGANDGSNTAANYYHFGYAGASGTDRSLGGIAATTTADGIGYVGIRLRNGASVPVRNLEILYAMEQWYNSGRQDAATVSVAYRTAAVGTAVTSLLQGAGTWTALPPLQADAPSTATVIASRDGNSAANRRVRQTTLTGLNLLPGQEIIVRWAYALNNTTNGNGLSIDDVVITPETRVFYSKATGALDALATWGQNLDGTGPAPASFAADNQTFYVVGTAAADRITANPAAPAGPLETWAVSGANSKIVVGIPAAPNTGAAAVPGVLYLETNKGVAGTVDVSDGSAFVIRNTVLPRAFALGALGLNSTVDYNGGPAVPIITQSYGNLVVSAGTGADPVAGIKSLAGNIVVNGSVRLRGCGLSLGGYDLTLVRRDSLGAGGTKLNANLVRGGAAGSYVVTDGTGRLRISVPGNGVGILFPVGSASGYTPATLLQTAANSEDIFGVRVIDRLYQNYTAADASSGGAYGRQTVNKTWLVGEEVAGGSDLTLKLQWNAADAATDFVPAAARLNHYTGGAWDLNPAAAETGSAAGPSAGTSTALRAHIVSFSPFGVLSALPGAPLPVKLAAFTAQAAGTAAVCAWTTATETNNDHFVVERSLDGARFAAVGTVPGQGTSTAAHAYRFADEAAGRLGAPTVYYRLQQVDADRQASYSPVRAVAFAARAAAALYPTPTQGTAPTLDLTGLPARPYQVQVLDLAGRVVLARTLAGAQAHPFDVQALPAGAYVVLVSGGGTRQALPLLRD